MSPRSSMPRSRRAYTPRRQPPKPEVDVEAVERRARGIELRMGVAIPEGSALRPRFEKARDAARDATAHRRLEILIDVATEVRDELPAGVRRACLPDQLLEPAVNR